MYPLPIREHEECCSCASEAWLRGQAAMPCHLWIHKSGGPGRVITFPSVAAAYRYGEHYILSKNATPFHERTRAPNPWEKIVWCSEDRTWWWVEGGAWGDSLCQIIREIADGAGGGGRVAGDGRHHWLFLGTSTEQLLIGLGSDLPPSAQLTTCPAGYTLEDSETLGQVEVRQVPPHTSCGSWRCPYIPARQPQPQEQPQEQKQPQEQEQSVAAAPAPLDLSGRREHCDSAECPCNCPATPPVASGGGADAAAADADAAAADADSRLAAAEARILRNRRAVAAVREAFLHGSLGDPASATPPVSATHVSATEPVDFEGVD